MRSPRLKRAVRSQREGCAKHLFHPPTGGLGSHSQGAGSARGRPPFDLSTLCRATGFVLGARPGEPGAEGFEPSTPGLGTRCPIRARLRAPRPSIGPRYQDFVARAPEANGRRRSYRWSTGEMKLEAGSCKNLDPFERIAQRRQDRAAVGIRGAGRPAATEGSEEPSVGVDHEKKRENAAISRQGGEEFLRASPALWSTGKEDDLVRRPTLIGREPGARAACGG